MRSTVYSLRKGALATLLLAAICQVQIAGASSYRKLGNDRVLLFNNDASPGGVAPVKKQTYGDANWIITGDYAPENGSYNFSDGTHFEFPNDTDGQSDPSKHWVLNEVRLGNVFPKSDKPYPPLSSEMCYLPWRNGTALSYVNSNVQMQYPRQAGTVVMRNRSTSSITSPVYDEGIGHIYFDAVNATLAITNTIQLQILARGSEEAVPARVHVIAIVDGTVDEDLSYYTEIADKNDPEKQHVISLGATKGGTTNNFFRVVLDDEHFVDSTNAVRFVIRRLSSEGDGEENAGMVVLDNIICSYPAAKASITNPGTRNEQEKGLQTLGWVGAFNEKLPYFGETGLVPLGTITYEGTNTATETTPTEVKSATFRYRWRYLTQKIMGCPGTNTISTIGAAAQTDAALSGAILRVPWAESTYTNLQVEVSSITLGNLGYPGQVQTIEVNGVRSGLVNTNGTVDARQQDGSYRQVYTFEPALAVETETDYPITFYDQTGTPISGAQGLRVVRPSDYPADQCAVRVVTNDLQTAGNHADCTYLLAALTYAHQSDFFSLPMVQEGNTVRGERPLDPAFSADPGDIEFYYEATIDAPYYQYVDYTGLGGVGIDSELEKRATDENRRGSTNGNYPDLPSGGHHYFVRLRDGTSGYRDFDIEVRAELGAAVSDVLGYLGGSRIWRICFETPTNSAYAGFCQIRFRSVDAEGVTNYWDIANGYVDNAMTLVKHTGDEPTWYNWNFDAATGYMLFQYTEDDGIMTLVHADYQNFNGWSDANRNAERFVAEATATNGTVGVSAQQQTYSSFFEDWAVCSATDPNWTENFNFTYRDKPAVYTPITGQVTTPNNLLQVENFQWVYPKYLLSDTNYYAVQLQGNGKGHLQLVSKSNAPRGIESITYAARLAQAIEFNDFAYCSSYRDGNTVESPYDFSNYTISAQAALELNGGDNHDGAASLSLVAYYFQEDGCYEGRISQKSATTYELSINRWRFNGETKVIDEAWTNETALTIGGLNPKGRSGSVSYPTVFLCCTNFSDHVQITLGVSTETASLSSGQSSVRCQFFRANDYRESRFTAGTFGFLTANSEGRFMKPRYFGKVVARDTQTPNPYAYGPSSVNLSEGGVDLKSSLNTRRSWTTGQGRMQTYRVDDPDAANDWGFICSTNLAQTLILSTADSGTTAFAPLMTNTVTSFTTQKLSTFYPYLLDDCSVRLTTGGVDGGVRRDVVITSFSLSQWRGTTGMPDNRDLNATSIVYTTCWIWGDSNKVDAARSVEMNARRARTNDVVSIRSPLMDGRTGPGSHRRGTGLGMVAFAYSNVDERVNLLVQISTNVTYTDIAAWTTYGADSVNWVTLTNFTGTALREMNGVCSYSIGLHGVSGLIRLVMDPAVVAAADETLDPAYGRIFITQVLFRDEPDLDLSSWTGWNMRTGDYLHNVFDRQLKFLGDANNPDLTGWGQSAALNCSVTELVAEEDWTTTPKHSPYVQTPKFNNRADLDVGFVTFKARRYDTASDLDAVITLYGAADAQAVDKDWDMLQEFTVPCNYYTNFTYKAGQGTQYKAFRLAVRGVPRVDYPMDPDYDTAHPVSDHVRVALDEVLVAEGIYASLGFRNVCAIRNHLDGNTYDADAYGDRNEQPLVGESWGVQAEVYATRIPEEISWNKPITVVFHWYNGYDVWGYDQWKNRDGAKEAVLLSCEDTNLVFRSSYRKAGTTVDPVSESGVVQYSLDVIYYTADSKDTPVTNTLSSAQWTQPSWYYGVDYNQLLGKGLSTQFAAYNLLDTVSPGWAFFNEVNLFGGYTSGSSGNADQNDQYVEIAMPAEADLTGWELQFVERGKTNTVATFGYNSVASTKTKNMASNCVFLTVGSPLTVKNHTSGYMDGKWDLSSFTKGDYVYNTDGSITSDMYPLGMRLVRPSGVIEHEITCIGSNLWEVLSEESYYHYSPQGLADELNAIAGGAHWIVAGDDCYPTNWSLSVINNTYGMNGTNWSNTVTKSPGEINPGEYIYPDHPIANTDTIVVRCYIGSEHIRQTIAEVVDSADAAILMIKKGDPDGTNITYTVDNWYETDRVLVTEGDKVTTNCVGETRLRYPFNVARYASNTVDVVATARVRSDLRTKYGLTEDNRYTDAVIDWLTRGRGFRNPGCLVDTNELARVLDYGDRHLMGLMTLTEMYWLDMDPTTNGWNFIFGQAGVEHGRSGRYIVNDEGVVLEGPYTNDVVQIYMCISNDDEKVAAPYAPYVLNSMNPGETSWDYTAHPRSNGWDSVNLKIEAHVDNGLALNTGYVPVRWFVFGLDSFGSDFISSIEIWDTRSTRSPAYNRQWTRFPTSLITYKAVLDSTRGMYEIETMAPTNHYFEEENE